MVSKGMRLPHLDLNTGVSRCHVAMACWICHSIFSGPAQGCAGEAETDAGSDRSLLLCGVWGASGESVTERVGATEGSSRRVSEVMSCVEGSDVCGWQRFSLGSGSGRPLSGGAAGGLVVSSCSELSDTDLCSVGGEGDVWALRVSALVFAVSSLATASVSRFCSLA